MLLWTSSHLCLILEFTSSCVPLGIHSTIYRNKFSRTQRRRSPAEDNGLESFFVFPLLHTPANDDHHIQNKHKKTLVTKI